MDLCQKTACSSDRLKLMKRGADVGDLREKLTEDSFRSNIFWINLTHIFIAIQHPLFFWIERVQIGGFKTSFFQRVCQYLTGQYVANLLFMREIVLEI